MRFDLPQKLGQRKYRNNEMDEKLCQKTNLKTGKSLKVNDKNEEEIHTIYNLHESEIMKLASENTYIFSELILIYYKLVKSRDCDCTIATKINNI